jgi:nucleoside phosphorylase
MGWQQWEGDSSTAPLADRIPLHRPEIAQNTAFLTFRQSLLVTVAAASANFDQADQRRERYPNASAEDMEGFSVAAACHLANTPLTIIRGISNLAGERTKSQWRVEEAMRSVAAHVLKLMGRDKE